jgi:hypothetical protein
MGSPVSVCCGLEALLGEVYGAAPSMYVEVAAS